MEKKKGISFPYLAKGALKRLIIGKKHQTPGFGLASQLFSTMAIKDREKGHKRWHNAAFCLTVGVTSKLHITIIHWNLLHSYKMFRLPEEMCYKC
jgi:hypothetical protein